MAAKHMYVALLFCAACFTVTPGCLAGEGYTIEQMKAFRAQLLGDKKVRELWEEAEVERLAELDRQQKSTDEYYRRRTDTQIRCRDIAYKTKNSSECDAVVPVFLGKYGTHSREQYFDQLLLGICLFIDSANENKLKQFQCIPS